jgi:hypothetical protein
MTAYFVKLGHEDTSPSEAQSFAIDWNTPSDAESNAVASVVKLHGSDESELDAFGGNWLHQ